MDKPSFDGLEAVILDPLFAPLDQRLRSGFHVDRDDVADYEFLELAAEWLEGFYGAYQCRLVNSPEGYWFAMWASPAPAAAATAASTAAWASAGRATACSTCAPPTGAGCWPGSACCAAPRRASSSPASSSTACLGTSRSMP